MILLVIASIVVYFGLAQRLLDRMRITDKAALVIIAALIVGSFIDIPLYRGNIKVSVNVGGGLVPIGVAIYLFTKAGTAKEKVRALIATAVTAGVIYAIGSVFLQGDPGQTGPIDPLYIYPLIGGITAYILGRSRRAAFIAATLGVLALDFIHWIWLGTNNTPGVVNIGGAGAFDSIVIAGLFAVLLAEIIGETRERLQGGPESRGKDPELLSHLDSMDKNEDKPNLDAKEGEQDEEQI